MFKIIIKRKDVLMIRMAVTLLRACFSAIVLLNSISYYFYREFYIYETVFVCKSIKKV